MASKVSFSIFSYSSYLEFFQDAYEAIHAIDETFSYDFIAGSCALKSRTQARNFIKGTQPPNEAQLVSIGTCLGLDSDESKYLLCLFKFQQAKTSPAAFELFQKLMSIQKAKLPAINPFKNVEVVTSVLHMTLLSIFDLSDSPQDAESINKALKGRYATLDIERAVFDLVSLSYVWKNPKTAKLELCQKHISKYDYESNYFLKKFHTQCIAVARDALENEPTSERYLVGASFCINGKVFPRIVQKMNAFVENLMQLEGVAGRPDTVVQFNQQLIKMTSAEGHANNERGLGRKAVERGFEDPKTSVIA